MSRQFCFLMETTSPKGSIGLYSFQEEKKRNLQPLEVKTWESLAHSALITSAFESLFKTFQKLNSPGKTTAFLALGAGPGRFTGVRVGVSFAKTLGFALNMPLYPVSSLEILAESQKEEEKPILVLLNAFKNSLYMALYRRKNSSIMEELIPPCVVLAGDLQKKIKTKCVCVGDGYKAYKDIFPLELKHLLEIKENIFPNTKYLADFLQRKFDVSGLVSWRRLKPVYLRSPVGLVI